MTWHHPGPPPPPGAGHSFGRIPSGLFPSGRPVRPTYREPHPLTGGGVAVGGVAAAAWLLFVGLLGTDLGSYGWWTLAAAATAWIAALVLVRYGDRGVATGVAIVTAGGWSIANVVLGFRWLATGDWPLW